MTQATANGFKLRGLNQDAGSVSVQSNVETTWMLTYRRWGLPKVHDVGILRDELKVITAQGSGSPEIELEPLGDKAGTLVAKSSRKATVVMRVGRKYRFEMDPGEAIIVKSTLIHHPTGPGAGLSV